MKVLPLLLAGALCSSPILGLAQEAPTSFQVGTLTFQRPEKWEWVPVTSSMRKAQLRVPGSAGGEPAELVFFLFPGGQGGDIAANVQRWLKQFTSAPGAEKIESQEINGVKTTIVSTEGTFASGMPGGQTTPKSGYALLGAIMEGTEGNTFIKMTGPSGTVGENRTAFLDFLKTATTGAAK